MENYSKKEWANYLRIFLFFITGSNNLNSMESSTHVSNNLSSIEPSLAAFIFELNQGNSIENFEKYINENKDKLKQCDEMIEKKIFFKDQEKFLKILKDNKDFVIDLDNLLSDLKSTFIKLINSNPMNKEFNHFLNNCLNSFTYVVQNACSDINTQIEEYKKHHTKYEIEEFFEKIFNRKIIEQIKKNFLDDFLHNFFLFINYILTRDTPIDIKIGDIINLLTPIINIILKITQLFDVKFKLTLTNDLKNIFISIINIYQDTTEKINEYFILGNIIRIILSLKYNLLEIGFNDSGLFLMPNDSEEINKQKEEINKQKEEINKQKEEIQENLWIIELFNQMFVGKKKLFNINLNITDFLPSLTSIISQENPNRTHESDQTPTTSKITTTALETTSISDDNRTYPDLYRLMVIKILDTNYKDTTSLQNDIKRTINICSDLIRTTITIIQNFLLRPLSEENIVLLQKEFEQTIQDKTRIEDTFYVFIRIFFNNLSYMIFNYLRIFNEIKNLKILKTNDDSSRITSSQINVCFTRINESVLSVLKTILGIEKDANIQIVLQNFTTEIMNFFINLQENLYNQNNLKYNIEIIINNIINNAILDKNILTSKNLNITNIIATILDLNQLIPMIKKKEQTSTNIFLKTFINEIVENLKKFNTNQDNGTSDKYKNKDLTKSKLIDDLIEERLEKEEESEEESEEEEEKKEEEQRRRRR